MRELLQRDHPLDPPVENAKLVRTEICKATGLVPSQFSAARMSELFLAGTEPRESSASYFSADGALLLPNEYSQWCASRDNNIGAHVRAEARITNPPANARYEIDPALSSSQQMVELTAGFGTDVEWFVNGQKVSAQRNGRFFWQLAPGEWNLRAVSRGETAEENISVEATAN
jgi:membrane carboxypeptidase/penicillin-binding protein PbpC